VRRCGRPEETTSARVQFRVQCPISTAELEEIVGERLDPVLEEKS